MSSAWETIRARRPSWVLVRRVAVTAYLIVLAIFLWREGLPLDRVGQFAWIMVGLATVCIGRPWRAWVNLVGSFTAFGLVLLIYDYSRGMAYNFSGPFIGGYPAEGAVNPLGMPLHVTFPIRFDEFLFGGTLPTHWIQEYLHPGRTIPAIAIVVSLTYISHFLVMPITAVVLWVRKSRLFHTWLALALSLAIVGLAGYIIYPMTPPWLADRQGYIPGPPVLTLVGEGWKYLGIKFAASLINSGRALANPVAAMPSLHTAYATLATGFFFFTTRWRWLKIVIWCYPLLMCVSLVYGGEHYVTDEIFGVLVSGVILAVWRLLLRRKARRAAPGTDAETAAASIAGSAEDTLPDGAVHLADRPDDDAVTSADRTASSR